MTLLPTGKPHISFSELSCWKECPYRHKLQHIDKIGSFDPSPYLGFGTGVHESCEVFFNTGKMSPKAALENIKKYWDDNLDEVVEYCKGRKLDPNINHWAKMAVDVLKDVPAFFDEQFPGWEPLVAEEQLYEDIPNDEIKFKGFIDAVIKAPYGKKQVDKIWLLDYKTAPAHGWTRQKKQDFHYHLQLILYKYYWAQKHNVDPKDIKLGFVLLKRGAKPGKGVQFVDVSGSEAKMEKANKLVANMLSSIRKGFFPKNYNNCRWCEFKSTDKCPNS